jgi:serine/threonine-protein kinase
MSTENLLGTELGDYRLTALLGTGGMATVYWGVDLRSRRTAAIKVIDTSHRKDFDYRARFDREAQAIARLHHPHIVRLYRYGEVGDVVYIAMQHIQGSDLATVYTRYRSYDGWMLPADICRLAYEIGSALDYAHQQGIIHRDIKPANILLDQQGHATLTDFGLALLTDLGTRGEVFGTPYYIAPEQAVSSAGALPASDQYSLGVILYELFTGQVPFEAEGALDTAILHITTAPRPPREIRPGLGAEVEAVILKALEKRPEDRFGNCVELAVTLHRACQAMKRSMPASPSLREQVSLLECVRDVTVQLPTIPAKFSPTGAAPAAGTPSAPPAGSPPRKRSAAWLPWVLLALAGLLGVAAWWLNR